MTGASAVGGVRRPVGEARGPRLGIDEDEAVAEPVGVVALRKILARMGAARESIRQAAASTVATAWTMRLSYSSVSTRSEFQQQPAGR